MPNQNIYLITGTVAYLLCNSTNPDELWHVIFIYSGSKIFLKT